MDAGRYDTKELIENQYEPGSHHRVLRNLLGIKSKREMVKAETSALLAATKYYSDTVHNDHRFTAEDLRSMHRTWLGSIYEWAGSYRQVLMTKGGFTFAAPRFIPKLMSEFDRHFLDRYTPCNFTETDEILQALAVVHTEFLLIHPFRDGNGRVARLLATLMALQAGLPFLDFRGLKGKKKIEYFCAVQLGLEKNYRPMEKIFNEVISTTLKAYRH